MIIDSCQRCGGQVMVNFIDRYGREVLDDIGCIQCGAPHTRKGRLATYSPEGFKRLFGALGNLNHARPAARYQQDKYRRRKLQPRSKGMVKV